MMKLHSPADLERLTGLSVGNQRTWRRDGFFRNHGQQSPGGHWGFTDHDILFVAAARAVSAMQFGLGLGFATVLVDTCLLEIEGALTGRRRAWPELPFVFVWSREDCTADAERSLAKSRFTYSRDLNGRFSEVTLTVFQEAGVCAAHTDDPGIAPLVSRSGGILLITSDIARRIPKAVAGLFPAAP